jgi:hypothetical protein
MASFAERVTRQYEYEHPGLRLAHAVGHTGTLDVALFSSMDPTRPDEAPTFQILTAERRQERTRVRTHTTMSGQGQLWTPEKLLLQPNQDELAVSVPFKVYDDGNRMPISVNDQLVLALEESPVPLVEIPPSEHALAELLLSQGHRPDAAV